MQEAAQKLMSVSDYAVKHRSLIEQICLEDDFTQRWGVRDLERLHVSCALDLSVDAFMAALRAFRNRILLKLLLREFAGISDVIVCMQDWSMCADALILHAKRYCELMLAKQENVSLAWLDEQPMYTIAMGKLGGQELNYSSDIDLIFVFKESDSDKHSDDCLLQAFYCRVIQLFIRILQAMTSEGFVFRVDLRLRPHGESGALVLSMAAMETYYQEHGRDWERYAMIKGRLIEPSSDALLRLNRLITPFVYPRYVDFSVIESLRSIKVMIEREIKLDPMLNDIKRGQGGIREIEFIIQCLQLIRGGRQPNLRQQNALIALDVLAENNFIHHPKVIKNAYVFFRKLENMLQMQNDQQTHSLPTQTQKQKQLAYAMGYESYSLLQEQLIQYQRIVTQLFRRVLRAEHEYVDEKRLLAQQLHGIWLGHIEINMAVNFLANIGFSQPDHCYQMLLNFRQSSRCRRLTQSSRMRLDRFMVVLLSELKTLPKSEVILLQMIRMLEAIVGRSAYLALLSENPHVLQELLFWLTHSPYISQLLVQHPFLLDVLIQEKNDLEKIQNIRNMTLPILTELLSKRLLYCDDEEQKDEVLRQFKHEGLLLAARSELRNECTAEQVSQFLSILAEAIISEIVKLACFRLGITENSINFAILAYGKLGSHELNYDSDVDLVFLYQSSTTNEPKINRLTQKILHMLMMRTQGGLLYKVDTRLRPSGSAGLLVSHIEAFANYQENQAWTWEHQALLRARFVFKSSDFKHDLSLLKYQIMIRRNVLMKSNAELRSELKNDIKNMRLKINQHASINPVKHQPGGLLDLEFLVQYLILLSGNQCFTELTHTLEQIDMLKSLAILSEEDHYLLVQAYLQYHKSLHQQVLLPEELLTPPSNLLENCRIWSDLYD